MSRCALERDVLGENTQHMAAGVAESTLDHASAAITEGWDLRF